MIVNCNNCKKKFNIDSGAIPEKGRLLQCNNCKHKWFFKKKIINEPIQTVLPNTSFEKVEPIISDTIELLDINTKDRFIEEGNFNEDSVQKYEFIENNETTKIETSKDKKINSLLSIIILFIISLIAFFIILDTFQRPIGKIFPKIEIMLYNLYETINDILLFFNNLI
tara:strand:+ start:1108 stop:1611 length:504 start_codon:yes stop_codon:yes gene_type:complete